MKRYISLVLFYMLFISGCAQMFTAKTSINVRILPDGTCEAEYTSDKEHEGMEASICGGKIKTAKSGTLESAVAAVAESQAEMMRLLNTLLPAAAKAGALAGS